MSYAEFKAPKTSRFNNRGHIVLQEKNLTDGIIEPGGEVTRIPVWFGFVSGSDLGPRDSQYSNDLNWRSLTLQSEKLTVALRWSAGMARRLLAGENKKTFEIEGRSFQITGFNPDFEKQKRFITMDLEDVSYGQTA